MTRFANLHSATPLLRAAALYHLALDVRYDAQNNPPTTRDEQFVLDIFLHSIYTAMSAARRRR